MSIEPIAKDLDDGARLYELSPVDALMGPFSFNILVVFPPLPEGRAYDLERLHASLISVVDQDFPMFVGQPRAGVGSLAVYHAPEVVAHGARTSLPFAISDEVYDGTTAEIVQSVPASLLPSRDPKREVLTVKCTRLQDGGLVIGLDGSHGLADGEGFFTFLRLWGMHYRGIPAHERPVISHARQFLAPRGGGATMPHPEFAVPRPQSQSPSASQPPPAFPTTSRRVFHLAPMQLQGLKAAIASASSASNQGKPGAYVSTLDAVTALLAILITQARGHGEAARLTTVVNGRRRLASPPLPPHYVGNVLFNALSAHPAEDLALPLTPKALASVARRIRGSIDQRDDAYLRDAIEFVAAEPTARLGVDFFFGRDLVFTSWLRMGMYDMDLGQRPWYAGPPAFAVRDGMIILMEGIRGAPGVDAVVLLEAQAMARLDKLWGACSLLSSSPPKPLEVEAAAASGRGAGDACGGIDVGPAA